MKLTSKRFSDLKKKINTLLMNAIRFNSPKAVKYLARANTIARIQRQRNLNNGMPGTPWIDMTIPQVKAAMEKRAFNAGM